MATAPCLRFLRPAPAVETFSVVRSVWVPPTQCSCIASAARFSTSQPWFKRDNNRIRGLSAVRNTGLRPRQTLSVKQKDFENQQLPTPVEIEEEVTGTPDHGLWDFFKDQKLLQTPTEERQHGRAWTVGELRSRDWDSLHQLWWICVKERNRLATEKIERRRLEAGFGDHENNARDKTVQETMKAVLDTLAERQLAYQDAFELAARDPDINLSRTDGPQYTQSPYDPLEEDEPPYEAQPEPANVEPLRKQADLQIEEKSKETVKYT